jgi:hypothetical protein
MLSPDHLPRLRQRFWLFWAAVIVLEDRKDWPRLGIA